MTQRSDGLFAQRVAEKNVADILALIHSKPNCHDRPLPGDLEGDFDLWFDGGALKELTGQTRYVFRNGVSATVGLSAMLSVWIQFPDGCTVTIEQKEAAKEASLRDTSPENAMFQIYATPRSLDEMNRQFNVLRQTLNSVVQDVVVMKQVLEQGGLMDAALYKTFRLAQMLQDHASAGANPWENYSIYPYVQDEATFLRKALNATEAEVRKFQDDIESIQDKT